LFGVARDAIGLVGTRRYPALRAIADSAFDGATLAPEDLPDRIEREVEAQSELLTLGARTGYLGGWFGELDLLVKLPLAL
jgi:hypothetical protein